MSRPFDRFILLADMRTGSNYLEANLNAMPGVTCHGEAFNPVFIGRRDQDSWQGVSLSARDADPFILLRAMEAQTPGLSGFRFFQDHDPRVLEASLSDRRCAKIVLTRNPLESYISLKIARSTGQWRLGDARRRRSARAEFDAAEFEDHVTRLQTFQLHIQRALQISGQTAFWIGYEDLPDPEVIGGLAAFLGVPAPERLDDSVKKQNPEPPEALLSNPEDLSAGLARLDRFNLTRTPNFEPRRGPQVPSFVAAKALPLLYMPLRPGPEEAVKTWLATLGGSEGGLREGFDRRSLRDWLRSSDAARSFTVLRHPLHRVLTVFDRRILQRPRSDLRQLLRRNWKLDLPEEAATAPPGQIATAFEVFLRYLRANLAGQTPLKPDAAWAGQATVIDGFSSFLRPTHIWREEELPGALPFMAALAGLRGDVPACILPERPPLPDWLSPAHEAALRDVYARDYAAFGFRDLLSGELL